VTRVAAIDCGTNSIRLLVADVAGDGAAGGGGGVAGDRAAGGGGGVDGGRLVDVTRRMEIVRLGQGVDRTGRLAPEAIERTRVALAGYAAAIRDLGAERVRMVATSASRDAANADDFTAMVRTTLGVDPEVVSGDEEARLSYTGAVRGLSAPAPYLVVDIGGGSTEFVTGDAPDGPSAAISVDIGCVRMTERHLHGDPPTPAEVDAATADIGAAVDRALAVVPGRAAATLVGLAGSVTTVAGMALDLPAYDSTRIHHAAVSYDAVARVTADLLAMPVARRLEVPVMHPGRADVIAAGALVLRTIMEHTGLSTVVVSEHDILDGIAWSVVLRR
jgi:exopolyphosphatase/guanosine-5'-triphosphate,3'-diphosphate pyrophosphatase